MSLVDSRATLDFQLHKGQLEIFNDPARFKVVAAGRRWGKSFYACPTMLVNALQDTNEAGYDISDKESILIVLESGIT